MSYQRGYRRAIDDVLNVLQTIDDDFITTDKMRYAIFKRIEELKKPSDPMDNTIGTPITYNITEVLDSSFVIDVNECIKPPETGLILDDPSFFRKK